MHTLNSNVLSFRFCNPIIVLFSQQVQNYCFILLTLVKAFYKGFWISIFVAP